MADATASCRTTTAPASRTSSPPSWAPVATNRRDGSRSVASRAPAGAPARARRLGLEPARAQPCAHRRSSRTCRAGRSPRSSRRRPRPCSRRSRPACRQVSTEWSATASTCDGDVFNVLRWSTQRGDTRRAIPPESIQPFEPSSGADLLWSQGRIPSARGSRPAHLRGGAVARLTRALGTSITEVRSLLGAGEPFVYAYYDGIDKVSHEYGLSRALRRRARWVDHLVGDLLEVDAVRRGAASSPRTTARSTSATTCWPARPSSCPVRRHPVGRGRGSAGSTPGPGALTTCSPPRRPLRRRRVGRSRDQIDRRRLARPSVSAALDRPTRRRRARRHRARGVRRPGRQRSLQADRAPRLADAGRDARAARGVRRVRRP